MRFLQILYLKIKNTLRYRHNLLLLTALPALAAAGAWALLTFYIEGGANIPVGVLDYDNSVFSRTVIARFADNATVGVREFDTEGFMPAWDAGLLFLDYDDGDPDGDTPAADDLRRDADTRSLAEITDSGAYKNAAKLVRIGSLETVIVIMPGFSDRITNGLPEGLFHIICQPAGVARGIVAELFAAQVSRLYFNSDSANRVVRDADAAAVSARNPPLTDDEKREIYETAFAYCDSYWEPQPLMTVEYERFDASLFDMPSGGAATYGSAGRAGNNALLAMLPGSAEGWQDLREMLNDLIARAVLTVFFVYAVFCVVNATGVMIGERADGVLTRLKANGYGVSAWIAASAAAPFIIYGIPCTALLSLLTKNASGAIFAFTALLCVSILGALVAFIMKKQGFYRVYILVCVIFSAGVSLYML